MKNKRSRSNEAFARANRVIPGGVNSPARAFGGVGGQPVFMARGERRLHLSTSTAIATSITSAPGARSSSAMPIRAVVAGRRARPCNSGASFGAPTELETQLAELICRR